MNHVLEHLYRPLDVLYEVRRVLKPSGVLHIAVPNPEGYSARRYGTDWFALDCPRHIMLFGPMAAQHLLSQAGFATSILVGNPVVKDLIRSRARAEGNAVSWDRMKGDWRMIKAALIVRREARAGRFDQFHLFARTSS